MHRSSRGVNGPARAGDISRVNQGGTVCGDLTGLLSEVAVHMGWGQ